MKSSHAAPFALCVFGCCCLLTIAMVALVLGERREAILSAARSDANSAGVSRAATTGDQGEQAGEGALSPLSSAPAAPLARSLPSAPQPCLRRIGAV